MRLTSILSEAMRNIASGTSRAVLLFLAVLLTGGLLGGYEAMSVTGLEAEATTRIQAYADVKTLVGGTVDGTAADRLAMQPGGPGASGAMRKGPQVTPLATPGKDVSSYEVTPGLLRLLVPAGTTGAGGQPVNADAGGVWVPRDLAHDFGLTAGSELATDRGTVRVAGVYSWPNDGRDTRFAYALIIPVSASSGTFEEAWARQWPASGQLDQLLYSTAVATGGGQSQAGVTALNKGFDSHYDATGAYETRMTRWMPWAGLAVGALIGLVSVRRRRLEYAGALHSGQTKAAQLLTVAIETLVWSGAGTLASCVLLAAFAWRTSADSPGLIALTACRTPLALFTGILLAAVLATLTIRESRLFRYFKNR